LPRSATRAKASRASSRGKTESIVGRSAPASARRASSSSWARLGSHHEVRRTVHLLRDGDHSAGGAEGAYERLAADRIEDEVARLVRGGQLLPGELDGEMADAATRTQDAHALALAQLTVIEEALPRAEPSERERRALDVWETAWLRREHGRRNERILCGDAVAVEGVSAKTSSPDATSRT
jgi:hypothetical protein